MSRSAIDVTKRSRMVRGLRPDAPKKRGAVVGLRARAGEGRFSHGAVFARIKAWFQITSTTLVSPSDQTSRLRDGVGQRTLPARHCSTLSDGEEIMADRVRAQAL